MSMHLQEQNMKIKSIVILLNDIGIDIMKNEKQINYIIKIQTQIELVNSTKMGNQQCKECKDNSVQNYAYGSYQICQQNNHYYAIIEKKVEKDKQLQAKVKAELQMRKNISNLHITKLHKYQIVQQNYGFKAIMYYEYVPKTLRERYHEIKQSEQSFTERQLFAIAYGIQQALRTLDSHKIKHHCINLDTILVKNNIFKLTDVSSTTYITSYDLAVKGSKEEFLSESLLQKLTHQSLHPTYKLKDDLFSLAIICLMLGTKRQAKDYYNFNVKNQYTSLNVKNIEKSLKQIQRRYGNRLMKKIKQLLYNKDPSQSDIASKTSKQLNLTSTLHELDDQIHKILAKTSSLNSTTAISPQRSIRHLYM